MYTIISITLKKCMPCMPKTEKIKEYRILDTFLKQQKTNKKLLSCFMIKISKYHAIFP